MDRLIYVSIAYIPDLEPPRTSPSCRKVFGGGGWVVGVYSNFGDHPRSLVQADQFSFLKLSWRLISSKF